MSITFDELCGYFSKNIKSQYLNKKYEFLLLDAKMLTNNQNFFENNIVYIGKTSMLKKKFKDIKDTNLILINDNNLSIKDFFLNDLNIIEIKDSEDIFEIYNLTRDFFISNIEIEHYTAALFKSYIVGKGLFNIVKVASDILNNPVIVMDLSYKILAYSNIRDITDDIWIDNIKNGYCSYDFIVEVKKIKSVQDGKKFDEPYEVICNKSPILKLISKIKINNKHVGNVILLECKRPIIKRDKEILKLTSEIVAEEMKKNVFYRNTKNVVYEDFIYDVLEGNLNERDVVKERMKSANIKLGKKLLVLIFDISKYNPSDRCCGYLRDTFNSLFPSKSSVYYNDNIVIINDNNISNFSEEFIERVEQFLILNKIYLGVSREFSDIMECRKYYLQAAKAVKFKDAIGDGSPIIFYSDIQIYDILSSAYEHMEYKDFCNPILIKLKEYDKLNNTELYKTLFIYLKNNQSIQKSSKELFIHRNTMRARLQKINELTNLDYSNVDSVCSIYLAYKVNSYYNNIIDR
ncbi:sugar diacid utilization regulator [Clostridium tetanomorphum]|uniref:PucR family transcriptional regulator n=1 Tax=Clostridium tetanomorphum TaxID=1553 RepID=UPI00044954D6|nr:helix-turn-helix domain-containing protein [Clostridium tetanomorphum]KAJ50539.1 putative PucR family transcriptional regulator [Clostridium tetanomorphum DSM 665]MBP1866334.1 sugar diacid utilization regulator [Clostridium tetanomorphum]NRS83228.1 sugar diacid utilization regulator [Clostridium tetanomorphum]SQC01275.1 transcriptional regulator [Clostridium tetanomorphum]